MQYIYIHHLELASYLFVLSNQIYFEIFYFLFHEDSHDPVYENIAMYVNIALSVYTLDA